LHIPVLPVRKRLVPGDCGAGNEGTGAYALFFASLAADLSFATAAFPATLLFFFDVVITSFAVVVVLLPHICDLLVPGYTLSSRNGNPGL
jgi:hypothetical protein